MGLEEAGLDRLIRAGYGFCGLSIFHRWPKRGTHGQSVSAPQPQAAGVIHGDFERGFIRAETVAYDDYIARNGESGARDGQVACRRQPCRPGRDAMHFLTRKINAHFWGVLDFFVLRPLSLVAELDKPVDGNVAEYEGAPLLSE